MFQILHLKSLQRKTFKISPPNKYIDNKARRVVTEVIIVLDNVSLIEIFVNSKF